MKVFFKFGIETGNSFFPFSYEHKKKLKSYRDNNQIHFEVFSKAINFTKK